MSALRGVTKAKKKKSYDVARKGGKPGGKPDGMCTRGNEKSGCKSAGPTWTAKTGKKGSVRTAGVGGTINGENDNLNDIR